MDPLTMAFLFVVSLFASFIGTSVGGSAVITIPAMIFAGVPPRVAIATNKMGSLGMNITGFYKFHASKKINYTIGSIAAVFALIGSYIGANVLLNIPSGILETLVYVFIIAIVVIFLLNKEIGVKKLRSIGKLRSASGYLSFLLIGFWAGLFGAGASIFVTFVFVYVFGQTFLECAGTRKLQAFAGTIMPLAVYSFAGIMNWTVGIVLFAGMGIGSYAGAGYSIKKGNKWVRILFFFVAVVSVVKLILG
jgi:uncharacterized membrane protein YfcA